GKSHTARAYVFEKSHSGIVPMNHSNKDGKPSAESAEGRPLIKENACQPNTYSTQSGKGVSQGLAGVRKAARENKEMKFTALLHHLTVDLLRESFYSLKRKAAPGVDGVTWQEYETGLEDRLTDLHGRVHRGAYRALPSRRVYIQKGEGRQRPLCVAALEHKSVQQVVVTILNQIYEEDFLGFSYGFRPGRSQHDALDALSYALLKKKVNYILDADIRGFFDNLDKRWLVKFVEHRVADPRILRLIQKWLKPGVLEEGKWSEPTTGSPQGSVISPLLAKFGLELHPDKTRRIEFGRFAEENRKRRGEGKPETFDFLGFKHISGKNSLGRFTVRRTTIRKRMRSKLRELKQELHRRMHDPVPQTGGWLKSVVQGYFNYYAVPGNLERLAVFRERLLGLWWRTLRRRSQQHRLPWTRMLTLGRRWLPQPHVLHPYPAVRFAATHLR